jgi:MoaA/NifB/PqqE/SkfB family radical SAM enzyme
MPNGDVFPCHVLTEREFRCGNVREQRLVEICRRNGLLGQLRRLDFHTLAQADERVAGLTRPGTRVEGKRIARMLGVKPLLDEEALEARI